jgi:hypothetical protein
VDGLAVIFSEQDMNLVVHKLFSNVQCLLFNFFNSMEEIIFGSTKIVLTIGERVYVELLISKIAFAPARCSSRYG